MGTVVSFFTIGAKDIDGVREKPIRLLHYLYGDEFEEEESLFTKFLIRIGIQKPSKKDKWEPHTQKVIEGYIDKAWHSIHFLFTQSGYDSNRIKSFMLSGGEEIGEDMGYGSPRLFQPDDVRRITHLFDTFNYETIPQLLTRESLKKADIYPQLWQGDENENITYVTDYFKDLHRFFTLASEANQAVIIVFE